MKDSFPTGNEIYQSRLVGSDSELVVFNLNVYVWLLGNDKEGMPSSSLPKSISITS